MVLISSHLSTNANSDIDFRITFHSITNPFRIKQTTKGFYEWSQCVCIYVLWKLCKPIVDFYEWMLCLPTSDRLALAIALIVECSLWCGACIIKINQRRHILIQFIVRVRDFETLFAHLFFFYSMKINNFICIIDKIDMNPKSNNTVNLPLNIFIHWYTVDVCVCNIDIDWSVKAIFRCCQTSIYKIFTSRIKTRSSHSTMSIKIAPIRCKAFESELEKKSTLNIDGGVLTFLCIARNQMYLLYWTNRRTSLISH